MTKDGGSDDAVEGAVSVGLRFLALLHAEDLMMPPPLYVTASSGPDTVLYTNNSLILTRTL